jgi:hypothetical protein
LPIKVYKVAEIIDGEVVWCGARRLSEGELAAALTSLEAATDPAPGSPWTFPLTIGEGQAARHITIELAPVLSRSYSSDSPLLLRGTVPPPLIYFRDRLFVSEPAARSSERAEVELRVKKAVYDEEAELTNRPDKKARNLERKLDQLLEELERLIGLGSVKTEVRSLVNLMRIRELRRQRGLRSPEVALHLVFTGNPGTGKTTIAVCLPRFVARWASCRKGISWKSIERASSAAMSVKPH